MTTNSGNMTKCEHTVQNMYGRYSYGSSPFGSGVRIQADISIQDITIGETSCTNGCVITCISGCPATVDIVVTWLNSGTDVTFIPWITISGGNRIDGEQITVAQGDTGTTTFPSVSLPRGVPQVCFNVDINS